MSNVVNNPSSSPYIKGRGFIWILGIVFALSLSVGQSVHAQEMDTDGDGLSDIQETQVYHTDSQKFDTDGDEHSDGEEVGKGYSPHIGGGAMLKKTDFDHDGLTDAMELQFGTDLGNPDTDGDGYLDGAEVKNTYDPNNIKNNGAKLIKKIEVNLKQQKMKKILGDVVVAEFSISTGKWSTPTPTGNFRVLNKIPRAWSKKYGLYMPYWMAFTYQGHGMHELPEWPGGKKEGANHLGKPVSHGCIRLGIGPAKEMYDWAEVGTKVVVVKQ